MKRQIFVVLILLISVASYSQFNKNIAIEVRYPLPIGDNFINKGFDKGYLGIIDLGLDYNVIEKNGLGLGIVFNTSYLRFSETDVNLLILSPKIKLEYEIELNKLSIIPQIGVGFSSWQYRVYDIIYTDELGNYLYTSDFKQIENGLTLKGATKFVINTDKRVKWYFNIAYEFTRLEKSEYESANTKYNRNIQMIYPGVGMIWNFSKS
ncbi:MAG: hypothetical protein IPO21_08780 [Bacteroidales bacterium]|nr:hypothetical protein [Bacteroidales bacterium]